jgi:hypothetical protein
LILRMTPFTLAAKESLDPKSVVSVTMAAITPPHLKNMNTITERIISAPLLFVNLPSMAHGTKSIG